MGSKRYEHKLIEHGDAAEFGRLVSAAGAEGWAAAGYAVLPSGERSALVVRKTRDSDHHHDRHRRREIGGDDDDS